MNSALQATDRATPVTPPGRALAAVPLYLGMAAAGVGVALPGALLPAILLRWHLQDEQGGRLFLMAWIGSSLGALLVSGSMRTVLLCGSVAVAVGAVGLSLCAGRRADAYCWAGSSRAGKGCASRRRPARPSRRAAACAARWAPAAPRPPRPCRRCRAGRSGRRPWRWRRHAARRRSRR